uniref:Uncharacterized protein n=1 Tax=Anguilla anguilla TaxID=7936 RepID=A0A0E9TNX5_ANGAN
MYMINFLNMCNVKKGKLRKHYSTFDTFYSTKKKLIHSLIIWVKMFRSRIMLLVIKL